MFTPQLTEHDEHKESFYQLLEQVYDTTSRTDINLVVGDKKAKIGKERD